MCYTYMHVEWSIWFSYLGFFHPWTRPLRLACCLNNEQVDQIDGECLVNLSAHWSMQKQFFIAITLISYQFFKEPQEFFTKHCFSIDQFSHPNFAPLVTNGCTKTKEIHLSKSNLYIFTHRHCMYTRIEHDSMIYSSFFILEITQV